MARSQETFNKKEVRNKKEKKRKEKEKKKIARKDGEKNSFEDMIAYVDEFGRISSTPPDPLMKNKTKLEDIAISTPKQENKEVDVNHTGVITFFNTSKGFGFIRDLKTQESVFFHINNVIGTIQEKSTVSFEVENNQKGISAVNVKIISI